jgi:endonuclease YncB( thermonuclease family)
VLRTIIFFLVASAIAIASPYPVTFISSHDADTCKVIFNGSPTTVRLALLDAPELKQEYGPEAKAKLNSLLYKKTLTLSARGTDKYRRTVGVLFADGKDVNAELVRAGYAWSYYGKTYLPLQLEAQKAKRGLWKSKNPIIPPWEFRAEHKHAKQAP